MAIQIRSDALAKLVSDLDLFVQGDAGLRLTQAQNEAQAVRTFYGNSYTAPSSALSAVTPFQPLSDPSLSAYPYSSLIFITDENSGKARYTIDGIPPKADGSVGVPVYSGGCVIPIVGSTNIRQFQVIAETGQTVNFAAVLFR